MNQFQGMNSASLCSLAGRYDNPIPPRYLAPIDTLKIQALGTRYLQYGTFRHRDIKLVLEMYCTFFFFSLHSIIVNFFLAMKTFKEDNKIFLIFRPKNIYYKYFFLVIWIFEVYMKKLKICPVQSGRHQRRNEEDAAIRPSAAAAGDRQQRDSTVPQLPARRQLMLESEAPRYHPTEDLAASGDFKGGQRPPVTQGISPDGTSRDFHG